MAGQWVYSIPNPQGKGRYELKKKKKMVGKFSCNVQRYSFATQDGDRLNKHDSLHRSIRYSYRSKTGKWKPGHDQQYKSCHPSRSRTLKIGQGGGEAGLSASSVQWSKCSLHSMLTSSYPGIVILVLNSSLIFTCIQDNLLRIGHWTHWY